MEYTIYATYPAAGPINNINNEVKYNPLYAISIPIKLAQELNDVIQPHNPVPIPMNMFSSGLTLRLCDNNTFDTPSIELKCELN